MAPARRTPSTPSPSPRTAPASSPSPRTAPLPGAGTAPGRARRTGSCPGGRPVIPRAELLRRPVRGPVAVEWRQVGAPVVALLEQQQRGGPAGLVHQPLRLLPRDEPVPLAHNRQQRAPDPLRAPGEGQLGRLDPGRLQVRRL